MLVVLFVCFVCLCLCVFWHHLVSLHYCGYGQKQFHLNFKANPVFCVHKMHLELVNYLRLVWLLLVLYDKL